MILKLARERAIEGGWKPSRFIEELGISVMADDMPWQQAALDPLFWQALGKSCGWHRIDAVADWQDDFETWKHHAHRFYDFILTGGDTEKFWEELLNS